MADFSGLFYSKQYFSAGKKIKIFCGNIFVIEIQNNCGNKVLQFCGPRMLIQRGPIIFTFTHLEAKNLTHSTGSPQFEPLMDHNS